MGGCVAGGAWQAGYSGGGGHYGREGIGDSIRVGGGEVS